MIVKKIRGIAIPRSHTMSLLEKYHPKEAVAMYTKLRAYKEVEVLDACAKQMKAVEIVEKKTKKKLEVTDGRAS